ncbi:hypothetical protein HanRHA438_Chr16g0751121 [Helianthus annuus]|nr:hypothetical protein HanRHA438_Chr16g0751121 [Helianthus annuus]
MSQSIQAARTQNFRQLPATLTDLNNITQFYNPSQSKATNVRPPKNRHFTQRASSQSQNTQNAVITFGNYALQRCDDPNTKFRPIIGMQLTEKQQCLLDNLWHIQTMPQASTFKVQVLNALNIYFYEQSSKTPEKPQRPKFTHYVIFRGTKIGIFNKWETVAKHIQCPNPITINEERECQMDTGPCPGFCSAYK